MFKELSPEQHALVNLMGDISERCYSAGWMLKLEYSLWDCVINGEKPYGRDRITAEDIAKLKYLSEKTNCWILFDDDKETAIDLDKWKVIFADHNNVIP